MVLCDFFPLYDFPDVCPPTVETTENRNSSDGDAIHASFMATSADQTNNTQETTTVPYGFQRRNRPSVSEIILIVWVSTLFLEELRQVINDNRNINDDRLSLIFLGVRKKSKNIQKYYTLAFSSGPECDGCCCNHVIHRGMLSSIREQCRLFLCCSHHSVG